MSVSPNKMQIINGNNSSTLPLSKDTTLHRKILVNRSIKPVTVTNQHKTNGPGSTKSNSCNDLREEMLEKERRDFKAWLMMKKQVETEQKKFCEKKLHEMSIEEITAKKRQKESELSYHVWLIKKEEDTLLKKINDTKKTLKHLKDKDKRLEESKKAYNSWLEESKNRPKPIPMNQGLRSLCSSSSVGYVNPTPWNCNVDVQSRSSR